MFTDFTARHLDDGGTGPIHNLTFAPRVSMIVSCRDQENRLLLGGTVGCARGRDAAAGASTAGACSGRSSPQHHAELMADAATREKLLHMGKIDLAGL